MLVSILHRASGQILAFAGLSLLVWWLAALAGGEGSYQTFAGWVWPTFSALKWGTGAEIFASLAHLFVWLTVIATSWSFFNHLASGLRHFVLDIGAGFELESNNRWSVITSIAGVLMTAAFWAAMLR